MGNRTSKKTKINSKDKAILELKVARDKLKKYTKKLDVEKTVLQEQARKLLVHGQKVKIISAMRNFDNRIRIVLN